MTRSIISHPGWVWIAWIYHILFGLAITWPGQALVNTPQPLILGIPRQMAWGGAWIIGSLLVLWRLDAARQRESLRSRNRTSGAP